LKPYTYNAGHGGPFTRLCEDWVKPAACAVLIIQKREGNSMGFRFRKTIKLFPGVKLNFSKSGVSTSIGGPGATINISKHGTRGTVGIPGTGVSYSENLSKPEHPHPVATTDQVQEQEDGMSMGALLLWGILGLFVFLLVYGFITG
jgi:hypothetical protein